MSSDFINARQGWMQCPASLHPGATLPIVSLECSAEPAALSAMSSSGPVPGCVQSVVGIFVWTTYTRARPFPSPDQNQRLTWTSFWRQDPVSL